MSVHAQVHFVGYTDSELTALSEITADLFTVAAPVSSPCTALDHPVSRALHCSLLCDRLDESGKWDVALANTLEVPLIAMAAEATVNLPHCRTQVDWLEKALPQMADELASRGFALSKSGTKLMLRPPSGLSQLRHEVRVLACACVLPCWLT